ncbi:MAG TPA: DinB family protein [Blastocatellia bacterium]|nr:DinB family protein [Blastocatellia bacterium]
MNGESQTVLTPELADLRTQLESVNSDAHRLLDRLTDAQAGWQAESGRWSIGQCISHLIVASRADLPHIEDAIKDARARGLLGNGPFRYNPLERLLTWSMDAPARIKVKNPKVYTPAASYSVKDLSREFFELQGILLRLLIEANGLHLRRVRVKLPMTNLFTLSLGQEFALFIAHQRRHIAQASEVTQSAQFPGVAHGGENPEAG